MKKLLKIFSVFLLVLVVTGGFLVFQRFSQNPLQLFPFPYSFSTQSPRISLDAPILIVGDRMGNYFSKFQAELAATISQDLSKPIRIQSLAKDGHAIHRTLHELSGLSQWPQILIYQGASEEFREEKFLSSEIPTILTNFHRYNDDRIQTALILYPILSRVIYEPLKRVQLNETIPTPAAMDEDKLLKRLEMELRLFEEELSQLVKQSRDRGSLLILTTTPINLDVAPKKVCTFSTTTEIEQEIADLEKIVEAENYKSAVTKSAKLTQQNGANAKVLFLDGQINKKLGRLEAAKESLLKASAYDCEPWRATELQNNIIRKVAAREQVLLYDFAELVNQGWSESPRFFDEIYPQNIVYEEGMRQLGAVIKRILKL